MTEKAQQTSNIFPLMENKVSEFWLNNNTFQQSLDKLAKNGDYSFYDGPPFATGTPHYGHLVANLMKDVVPRFWTMNGYRVERRWGWDCHGLPIENIVEKELGFKSKKDILAFGIDKFNERCRERVLEFAHEWEKTIKLLGRWVDFEHGYLTMDLKYMESIWWVFKELYDKGLVYEGYRSMHVCPRCETTLSQSEVAEGYKDIKDLSCIAKFELVDELGVYVLAWTTTPWTLIGNVALAVGKDIDYVKLRMTNDESRKNELFIIAKSRVVEVFKDQEVEIIKELKGTDLIGKQYKPLFDYYAKDENLKNRENGWQVYDADFVTTEDGTGVVHIAPAFGEDDLNLGKVNNLPFVQHVGMDGIIKPEAGEFAGLSVKPINDHTTTDIEIIKYLAHQGLLFSKAKYEHSYPHCWRCDTPLLNYATGSWFVSVEKIKETALKTAENINWSPEHIKAGRFGQWLSGARDWSISRQRFWASVIPIWKCQKCGELEVFGSVADLEAKSQVKITDLHKHTMDKIELICERCSGKMFRIPDVLDTWFDSGSMPYAQSHYPLENQVKFAANFPAAFIAEGVDQTRCWFYYLHIIANGLFNKAAFKNVIVNGIVLAEDGKKMSKKLKNYPDPNEVLTKYGADALRLYLLSSPVMQAENLNFTEAGVNDALRKYVMIFWNIYKFWDLYKPEVLSELERPNKLSVLDKWIILRLDEVSAEISMQMGQYNLPKAVRPLALFLDDLSTWWLRRSRDRLKEGQGVDVLGYVLQESAKLLAPFAPFVAESVWQSVSGHNFKDSQASVHLENWPKGSALVANERMLLDEMILVRKVCELGLKARDEAGIKVRQPLNQLRITNYELQVEYSDIIKDELNVKEIVSKLGAGQITVELDTVISSELELEGLKRELTRAISNLRKQAGLTISDKAQVYINGADEKLRQVISEEIVLDIMPEDLLIKQEIKINGLQIILGLKTNI